HGDAAGQVLEPELGEGLALLREASLDDADDPADRDDVPVAEVARLRELAIGLRGERVLHLEQRVVRDELPEDLLLEPQERALLELRALEHALVDIGGLLIPAAEQRELPGRLRLALRRDRARDLLLVRDECLPRVAERVERPRVDEALEHLLREDPRVDLAA